MPNHKSLSLSTKPGEDVMENNLILICLIGHILGDYYFQTNKMAQLKGENFKHLLIHGFTYAIPYMIIFLFMEKTKLLLLGFLIIIIIHLIVDIIKFMIIKTWKTKIQKDWILYLIDQSIHIITIFIVSFCVGNIYIGVTAKLQDFLFYFGLTSSTTLKWILLLFFIYKPINITFVKMFSTYKPMISGETSSSNKKAGAVIGFLERALIIILLYLNQYSAVGLILTAKSIARYDMISKNQEFAEYYLIGTLTSVLFSITSYYFIFYWL
jgi:hypothetical protein